jgi:predicted DCC family thiol-disulfide oxidoreductase YuxK
MATQQTGIEIVYDGQCPFCASYVRMTRLRAAAGPVRLIDARSDAPEVADLAARGIDLDRGMVVREGGQLFHGEAAIWRLAVLTAPGGPFNGLMRRLFASPRRAAALYPWLVRGRGLALRLLGRPTLAESRRRTPGRE